MTVEAVMEWIANNKEWLFSGVLISIPIALTGWFFSTNRKVQSQKGGKNSVNIQVGGNLDMGDKKDDR